MPNWMPFYSQGQGFATPYGVLLSPGSRVAAYVRSTGAQSDEDPQIAQNLVTTLSAGLARTRSGYGDVVVVLPSHKENVTDTAMLSNLVDGARIIGIGVGSNKPTFTWTATTGQWQMKNKDVAVAGVKFDVSGANNVAKAINVTAADNYITNCEFVTATGAANYCTIAVEAGAGADRFEFSNNIVRGTSNCVGVLNVAAVIDQLRVIANSMICGSTSGNMIQIGAAATNLLIQGNFLKNITAASDYAIVFGAAASTGIVSDNYIDVLNNGTANTQGISVGATTLCQFFQNFCSGEPRKSGVLTPAAAT